MGHMENTPQDLQVIMERLAALEKENATLTARLSGTVPAALQTAIREPKVGLPDKFDGSRAKYRGFISQVDLLFMINPQRYPNDAIKIGTIGTLLTGSALTWFLPFLEKSADYSDLLEDYSRFRLLMDQTFTDVDRMTIAASKIRKLFQGRQPCATYAANFRLLASDLNWNDAALMEQFRYGLNDDIKDMLLHYDNPPNLDSAIARAIQIDIRLFERRQEKSLYRSSSAVPFQSSPTVSQPTQREVLDSRPTTPMDLDASKRGPLTEAEKKRRRENNLCLYCGNGGHFLQKCPLAKPRTFNFVDSGKDQGQ
jgi:retrotransposon gag protein